MRTFEKNGRRGRRLHDHEEGGREGRGGGGGGRAIWLEGDD